MRPDFSKIAYQLPKQKLGTVRSRRAHAGVEHGRAHSGEGLVHGRRPVRHGAFGLRGGRRAVSARTVFDHVCHAAVDHPAIRRLLDGGRVERVLPAQSGGGAEGPLGSLRPGDASRLRFRQRARVRRCGQGRRGHRFRRRHEDPLRPDPAGADVGLHDHERRGFADHGVLYCGGGRAGRGAEGPERDHSERHSEGIHGPQHLHLSAQPFDEDYRRHFPLLGGEHAEIQLHFHQRISHAGSRRERRPGIGLHAGRRSWNTFARAFTPGWISTPSRPV
jgi:hypothetical protein